jgi:nucleoside-diphosphate-sugar epimerase
MVNVLVTGNLGYVGSVLTRYLAERYPSFKIIGFDAGFFAHCLTSDDAVPERYCAVQHFGDIREIDLEVLRGVDVVVHLAAVSNDPIGNMFEAVTMSVNRDATVRLANLCTLAGVSRFIFASSCSVYGSAGDHLRSELDAVNPVTAYARSKVESEIALGDVASRGLTVTNLRFATACGMSARLRLDLVLNDFVASAVLLGKIAILSDGLPWRPLIDVEDMARAVDWAISRTEGVGGRVLALNTGSQSANLQILSLANAVAHAFGPACSVEVNPDSISDKRSYQVDFSEFRRLAPDHQPAVSLESSIERLRIGLERMSFRDARFRDSAFIRLNVLRDHISLGRLDKSLRWQRSPI